MPLLTCALAGFVLIAANEPFAAVLEFDRTALNQGEFWRWGTAHFTHFDRSHLAWDLAVFGLLSGVIEHRSRIRLVVTIVAAALAVGAAVWWGQPHLESYRGLSGIDSALFGCLAGLLLRGGSRPGMYTGAGALVAFGLKCWGEMQSGAPIFAATGNYETVPLAHLTGLIAGVSVAGVPLRRHSTRAGTVTASRCRGSDSKTPPPFPSVRSFPARSTRSHY